MIMSFFVQGPDTHLFFIEMNILLGKPFESILALYCKS